MPVGNDVDAARSLPDERRVDKQEVVTGILWSVLQRWGVRVSTLATFVVLGRLLDPREFGVVALASVVVSLVNVFSEVGFSTYLVQVDKVNQRLISTVFWCTLMSSLVLSAAMAMLAGPVSGLMGIPDMVNPLRALALIILLTALSGTQTALLKRRLQFRTIAVRSLVATVVSCAVAIGLAISGAGIWALVGQSIAFSTVSVVVLWSIAGWRPSLLFDATDARTALAYGSSILGLQLLSTVRKRGDALVIGVVAGPVVLGFYTIAQRVVSVVLDTAVSVISTVANPVFARLRDEPERLRRTYVSSVNISTAILAPALLAVVVTAEVLLPMLFGGKWQQSVPPLQVLCLAGLMTTVVHFDRGLMLALGRQRLELVVAAATVVTGLAVVAALAPFGLLAVSAGVAVRGVLAWPPRLLLSCRLIGEDPVGQAWRLGRTCAAAILANAPGALTLHALRDEWAGPLLVVSALATTLMLYPACLWLLHRSLTQDLWALALSRRVARPHRAVTGA